MRIGSSGLRRVSLDTNILVYAHDTDTGDRHQRAVQLIEDLRRDSQIVVSTQLLNEFYAAITRPARAARLSHAEAVEVIQDIVTLWEVVPVTTAIVFRALEGMIPHGFAFWDALIWAAARENGATTLYTEDFQHGRNIEGVEIINPFAPEGAGTSETTARGVVNRLSVQRFKAAIVTFGNRTYVDIPFDPDDVWGVKERHYVSGSIEGRKIRGLLASE